MKTVFLALLLLSSITALAEAPIKPFTAHYKVFARGFHVGKGQLSLRYDANGGYFMHSRVEPSGLAALVVPGPLSEEVSGQLGSTWPQPQHYLQQQSGRKDRTVKLDFDWSARYVLAHYKDKEYRLSLQPRNVDPLSLHLLVMWDLQRGYHPSAYDLVTKNEVNAYHVEQRIEEIIATPLGELATLGVSTRSAGSSRVNTVWLAPSLNYLPVQIAQHKAGKEQLRLLLQSVQR